MTTSELFDRVLAKMEGQIAGPEIELVLPTALSMLVKKSAESPEPTVNELLRKDFTVTVTAGVGDLTASFAAAEPLLPEYLPQARVTTSGGVLLHYLPDYVQLSLERSRILLWYTVDKLALRTRNTDGNLTTLATSVTINGHYTPAIASVPSLLTDDLVDIVVGLLQ